MTRWPWAAPPWARRCWRRASSSPPGHSIELLVDQAVLDERMKHFVPRKKEVTGYLKRYAALVSGGAYGAILNG